MRKEILLAIIVGVIVGLAITFGIYQLRQTLFQNRTVEEIETSRQQDARPTPTPMSSVSLQQPEQDLLTDENTVQIVGRALPDSYIVILANETEYITTADQDGDFAQQVDLEAGGNKLTIVAVTPDGEQETVIRNVVYSTVDLSINRATDSADTESNSQTTQETP